MIDTHAHLDACGNVAAVLERARGAGVERVITIGTGIDSGKAALVAAESDPGVFAVLGIHPHDAAGEDADRLEELRALLEHERAVAVGETGLDFFRDYAPRDAQRRLFDLQLDLAADAGKPVVVHTRAAEDATLEALERFEGKVVLHCFSSAQLLPAALDRGYYVSFAGNVTYPKAADLRECAARIPVDRILAETDSPYLAPQPRRGEPNEPANVVHTVEALAQARGDDPAELAARIDANATTVFSLP